jgi:hypothetical protein
MTSDSPQRRGDAEDFYGMRVVAALATDTQPCHFDRREKSPAGREISPFGRDDKVDSRLKPILRTYYRKSLRLRASAVN